MAFRVGLGVALSALLIVAFSASGSRAKPTSTVPSTTTTTTTPGETTLPTHVVRVLGVPMPPITNPAPASMAARGCNFTTPRQPTTTISTIGRCTILEIGDSVGEDVALGISNQLSMTHGVRLVPADRISTGLTTPYVYDWPRNLKKFLSRFHPQLVVVCMGADDQHAIVVNGVAEPFGSKAWQTAYIAEVRKIVSVATLHGSRVLWIGLPVMRPVVYGRGVQLINALVQRVVTTYPGVTYLPIFGLFSTTDGKFRDAASVNHAWQSLRMSDGIHLSSTGDNVAGTYVVNQMAIIFHVRVFAAYPQIITG